MLVRSFGVDLGVAAGAGAGVSVDSGGDGAGVGVGSGVVGGAGALGDVGGGCGNDIIIGRMNCS